MNKDIVAGSWNELKGRIQSKWAQFTDNDLDEIKADIDVIAAKLQKQYGYAKARAEHEFRQFKAEIADVRADKKNDNRSGNLD